MSELSLTDIKNRVKVSANYVNQKDSNGRTPIFYTHDVDAIRLLILHGADTDITDNNGVSFIDFLFKPLITEDGEKLYSSKVQKIKQFIMERDILMLI